jgi:hypothetical protein
MSLTPYILLTALTLASPQKAEQKKQNTAKTPTLPQSKPLGTYKPSKMTPEKVAEKTGASIKLMKGVKGTVSLNYITSEGMGEMQGVIRIRDNRNYRMDYMVLEAIPFSCSLAADGKMRHARYGTQVAEPTLVAQRLPAANIPVEKYADLFYLDFSRMMFQGLTDGVDSWTKLVQSWKKNGYTLKVEERRLNHMGRNYLNYRITGTRAKAANSKRTNEKFVIVVDGVFWLPVTVTTEYTDANKKPWKSQWSAGYGFGAKFTAEELKLTAD